MIDIKQIKDAMNYLFDKFLDYKSSYKLNKKQYNDLLSLIVLSLYAMIPSIRPIDYTHMYLNDSGNFNDPNKNFYYLNDDIMIFNKHKNYNVTGKIIIPLIDYVDPRFIDVLYIYFKFQILFNFYKQPIENIPFLVSYNGNKLSLLEINNILDKIFE